MFQVPNNSDSWLQFFELAGNTKIGFKKIVSCLAWAYFFVFLCQVWQVWQQTPGLQRDAMACLKNHPNGLLPCWNLFQQANRRKKETQFCVIPSPKQTKNQIDIHWKKKTSLKSSHTVNTMLTNLGPVFLLHEFWLTGKNQIKSFQHHLFFTVTN